MEIKTGLIAALFLFCFRPEFGQAQYVDKESQPRPRWPELYASKSASAAFFIGFVPAFLRMAPGISISVIRKPGICC